MLLIAVVIGGLTAAVVVAIDWLPDQAAEQAPRVDALLWFLVIASAAIFVLVMTVMLYAVWRWRAAPDDDDDGAPIHGHTGLEITWTLVPAVLLAVMAVWAIIVLDRNENLDDDRLVIDVTAEQFAWTFAYPDETSPQVASGDLRVPVGRQVELRMQSRDVIHDFYVPEFRVKMDVVPGITTRMVFNPDKVGRYQVICAELCGVGHSTMRARVEVMSEADFEAWRVGAEQTVQQQISGDLSADPAQPTG